MNQTRRSLLPVCLSLLLLAALLATGCGGDADDQSEPEPEVTLATYNVGLARGFVPYATARTEPVARAVADIEADAVCVQEAFLVQDEEGNWTEEQIEAITEAASESFPHTYKEITEPEEDPNGEPACTQAESTPLRTCVEANCADVPDDQLSGCALDNCQTEFGNTSSTCQQCIAANLGKSIDNIIAACRGGSASLTSNGHNGLLLLSKHPLKTTEFTRFDSTVATRIALHATIDHESMGTMDLYCTHLTANLTDLEYPGEMFDSYEEEQAAQIDDLLAYIDETASGERAVLMGDMNTGPAKGELAAEFPDNYQKFVDAGLVNPYIDQMEPACTFCGSNTLNEGSGKKAIDHVFFDFGADLNSQIRVDFTERFGDETRSIETSEGTKDLHLSDHYGVRTSIELP